MEGTATLKALPETQRRRRGHAFYPPKADGRRIPRTRSTSDVVGLDDKVVHLHYFSSSIDWYVVEVDPETGEAWGFVQHAGQAGEWGYFSLPELEAIEPYARCAGPTTLVLRWVIERDCWFRPTRFADIPGVS